MGHVDYTGGGPLNLFGKAFRKANFEWTHELCRADTDGDGESNGQELGDPCCLWKTGKVPMRQWGLSHPGESHSTTGMNFSYYNSCVKKTGNDDFWSFYFANADDKSTPPFKRVGVDVHEWIQLRLRAYHKHGLNYFNPVASLLNDKGPLMRSTKELFTALLTMTVLYIVLVLAFRHAMCCCICRACGDPGDRCIRATTCLREEDNGGTNLENETIVRSKRTLAVVGRGSGSGSGSSTKETDHEMKGGCRYWCGGGLSGYDHMKLMVVAFVYTDWMSGLLHVVLDNPVMNTWPGIGPEARAFQGHHFDPTGVARGPILDMVREDHSVVFIVMIVLAVLRPSSPGLLTFGLHFSWMSHLMMASHRWSHTHPKYLSWMTIKMQQFGILMTTRHHSKHHASYDCNFCIFSGLMNKNELHGHTPMCGHMGTSGVQPKDIIIFLYTFYTFRKTLNHFRLFPPSFLFRLTVFLRLFPPSFLLSFLLHVPGILFSSLRFSGKTTHTHTTFLKKIMGLCSSSTALEDGGGGGGGRVFNTTCSRALCLNKRADLL